MQARCPKGGHAQAVYRQQAVVLQAHRVRRKTEHWRGAGRRPGAATIIAGRLKDEAVIWFDSAYAEQPYKPAVCVFYQVGLPKASGFGLRRMGNGANDLPRATVIRRFLGDHVSISLVIAQVEQPSVAQLDRSVGGERFDANGLSPVPSTIL